MMNRALCHPLEILLASSIIAQTATVELEKELGRAVYVASSKPPKTLSLDQCYLSQLSLNRKKDPKIAALNTAILKQVRAGKLICPAHVEETVFESMLLDDKERDMLLDYQNQISLGVAFQSFDALLRLETLALVRPTVEVTPYDIRPITISGSADLQKLASEIRAEKVAVVARASQKPYPPKSYDPKDQFDDILRKVSGEKSASMYRITQSIMNSGTSKTGREEWEYAAGVGEFLLEQQVTRLECANLLAKIISHEWEMMLILSLHTALWTKVEHDILKTNRAFEANDHIDILKLAVALRYSDAVTCDSAMKEILRQTRLATLLPVFSLREVESLLAWVSGLE